MQDIKNDSKILEAIDRQLKKLMNEAIDSVDCMDRAIDRSKEFLEGSQFDTVQQLVEDSRYRLRSVCESIESIRKYISDMQNVIREYSKFTYKG